MPMLFPPFKPLFCRLLMPLAFLFTGGWLLAAPTGPTLHFDYGNGQPLENPLVKFMYFVPLISPDPIAVSTNAGNTQCARVISSHCQTNGSAFHATCEFEVLGEGLQQNIFDHTSAIQKHDQQLKAGQPMLHQLDAINVLGSGSGSVEVEGTLANGQLSATEVRLQFNRHDHISPVIIHLHDIAYRRGGIQRENEIVARVNMLVFCWKAGGPKMEITLASVKPEAAGDSVWQNFVGSVRGLVANLIIRPLSVPADGYQAMLNFGVALALEKASFTFPFAIRLKEPSPMTP